MTMKIGTLLVTCALGKPIILEWKKVQGNTNELVEEIRHLSDIFVPSYTQTEVEFAQKKPEEVANDFMLKSLASLLHKDLSQVDWSLFYKKTEEHLRQFFATMDWKASSGPGEVHYFVVAKDAVSKELLGALQFFTSPDFEKGSIKAALSGVLPNAQGRYLESILVSSIFKIEPDIKRIFLHTRSTNRRLIDTYKQCGFTEFTGDLPNWTDLEYRIGRSEVLQTIACEKFIEE